MKEAREAEACPCKRKQCERYGDCAACRGRHETKKNPPYCERKKKPAAR